MQPILKGCFCCSLNYGSRLAAWMGALTYALLILYKMNLPYPPEITNVLPAIYLLILNVLFVVLFGASTCLIIGIEIQYRPMFVPWLVMHILGIIYVTSLVALIFMNTQWMQMAVIAIILHFGYALYQWLCVHSYYKDMETNVIM